MVQQPTLTLIGLNQSEMVKGGPSLWLVMVQIFLYVCVYVWCMCCCSQTERWDARCVASLATLSLDLATFQTPQATFFPKKRLVTNLATSWTNFSESLWSFLLPQQRKIIFLCICSVQWASEKSSPARSVERDIIASLRLHANIAEITAH